MHRGDSIAAAMGVGDPRLTHRFERAMPQQIQSAMARRTVFRLGEPARPGRVSAATRAARQQSAPPTEKPSARTGIGTQRRPAPAIRAGPLRRRTGTAAQTAAAQVGKRCQLSNRTRHGCIIAHTYDNAPGVAWPTLTSRSPTLTPGRAGQATPVTTLTRLRPSPGPSWATSS